MNAFIRSIVGIIGGAAVTLAIFLGVNAFLLPRPILYQDPEEPEKIYLLDRIICRCGGLAIFDNVMMPAPPDASNQWTEHDKAAEDSPQLEAPQPNAKVSIALNMPVVDGDSRHGLSEAPYPDECLEKGAQGDVLVQFDVTPTGDLVNIEIISSPDECFNQPVIDWMSQWKFKPAKDENGDFIWRRDVETRLTFTIEE